MTFIKVGNRLINTDAIASIHLDLVQDTDDPRDTFHHFRLINGTEITFTEEREVRVVRQYFSDPHNQIQDLIVLDELKQLAELLQDVRSRILASKEPVPPLVALACMHIHETTGASIPPNLFQNADLLSDSVRELLNYLEGDQPMSLPSLESLNGEEELAHHLLRLG